jgi:hypothetical protein
MDQSLEGVCSIREVSGISFRDFSCDFVDRLLVAEKLIHEITRTKSHERSAPALRSD